MKILRQVIMNTSIQINNMQIILHWVYWFYPKRFIRLLDYWILTIRLLVYYNLLDYYKFIRLLQFIFSQRV